MTNLTQWINHELYPQLFEVIDTALPEHDFKRFSGDWRSKTYLDGSPHKSRADKTVITKKAIGCILEQGGETQSLVNYVMARDNVDFINALKTLAAAAGLQIPKDDNFNEQNYQNYRDRQTILEDCNSYFIHCLNESKAAQGIKDYLLKRGYLQEDITAMELGYIPSQDKIYKYLSETKGYDSKLVKEVLILNKGIGLTHNLTIPYRSGSSIKGFKFRTIGDYKPKYLNSTGLDRSEGFFNILAVKGDKSIVIVEGELDSLHATVKGIDNIVSTGGNSISSDQIKDAVKRGAKSFTLCFDQEPDKQDLTHKKILAAISIIQQAGESKIYIVDLPDLGEGKTDPDRLIKERDADSLKEAIGGAISYYDYQLQGITTKYGRIEEKGTLTPKQIDLLLDEVIETSINISDPTDRDRFKKLFTSLKEIKELGITQESLDITIDRLTSTKDKEAQKIALKRLLVTADGLQKTGNTDEALELLQKEINEVKLKDKETEFNNLLKSTTEKELMERQINKPDSLESGYQIEGDQLLLPSGGLSVLAAPTSHGKTTFLINLALNVVENYPEKEIHLFSYEEDQDSIIMNALNTYLDQDISYNNRRSIRSYFATGSTEFIKDDNRDYFKAKKDEFFSKLIETKRLNIHYTDYDTVTLIQAIKYLQKHSNVGAIFIDYIQLLSMVTGNDKTSSRQEELKQVCLALKDCAVDTGLPIILGAQFNRQVVNHLEIHPTKIGEAGDIERIASLIVGFWNNNFTPVGKEAELKEIINKEINIDDTIYATVLKNRGGKVGLKENLRFNGNTGNITNIKSDDTSDEPF